MAGQDRQIIVTGMIAGVGVALLLPVLAYVFGPVAPRHGWLHDAFIGPVLALLLMIARLAALRFFDETLTEGAPYKPGSQGDIHQRVLSNTIEQLVLFVVVILALVPVLPQSMGRYPVLLGHWFFVARMLFWWGYFTAPPLRAFGFAATFYPSIVAAVLMLFWAYFGG